MPRLAGGPALLLLASCVGWQGTSGKSAISPPGVALHDPAPPPRATLLGTLWPPPGEPSFVVGGRRIVVEREGEVAAEPVTDRRGQFVANLARTGRYTATLSGDDAEATADVSVADLFATVRIDLVARRP
jgi:hypothetical protein